MLGSLEENENQNRTKKQRKSKLTGEALQPSCSVLLSHCTIM